MDLFIFMTKVRLFLLLMTVVMSFLILHYYPNFLILPSHYSEIECDTKLFKQTRANTCGFASLAFLFCILGFEVDEEYLIQHSHLSGKGTSLLALANLANEFGFKGSGKRVNYIALQSIFKPLILHLNSNHYIVLLEADNYKVVYFDPALGELIYLNRLQFEKIWDGIALLISPEQIPK